MARGEKIDVPEIFTKVLSGFSLRRGNSCQNTKIWNQNLKKNDF